MSVGIDDLTGGPQSSATRYEIDQLRVQIRDWDELLEGAQREVVALRGELSVAVAEIDRLTAMTGEVREQLVVAVEALENLPRLTLAALHGRCDAALAKIRGGA